MFDFELSRDQLAAMNALDTRVRRGPEPDIITLETYGRQIPEAQGNRAIRTISGTVVVMTGEQRSPAHSEWLCSSPG